MHGSYENAREVVIFFPSFDPASLL